MIVTANVDDMNVKWATGPRDGEQECGGSCIFEVAEPTAIVTSKETPHELVKLGKQESIYYLHQ